MFSQDTTAPPDVSSFVYSLRVPSLVALGWPPKCMCQSLFLCSEEGYFACKRAFRQGSTTAEGRRWDTFVLSIAASRFTRRCPEPRPKSPGLRSELFVLWSRGVYRKRSHVLRGSRGESKVQSDVNFHDFRGLDNLLQKPYRSA